MFVCKICNEKFNSVRGLINHLINSEKITTKDYYDKYINCNEKYCVCGNEKTFISLTKGYKKYCSVKCSASSHEIKEKRKKTCIERFGGKSPASSKVIIEKMQKTNMERYGGLAPINSEVVKNKIEKTNFERYGVINPTKNKSIKDKVKNTVYDKYGVLNVSQNIKVKQKIKDVFNNKYGVNNPNKLEVVKNKIKQTNIERYGTTHYTKSQDYKNKQKKKLFESIINGNRIKDIYIPCFSEEKFLDVKLSEKLPWLCKKCGNTFEDHLNNGRLPRCPVCFPKSSYSFIEKEIYNFCCDLIGKDNVEENNRTLLNGKEIDILIEKEKLGIEVNGVRWHSEINGNKPSNYHYDKYEKMTKLGYRLIQIFDDEIYDKKDIVISMITHALNKTKNKVYARNTEIKIIDKETSNKFLEDNHISGTNNRSMINIGLYYKDCLVFLMSIGKPRFNKKYQFELIRVCSKNDMVVIGGLSKTFKYFINNFDVRSVITYADLRFSCGDSYKKIGFVLIGKSKPSYFYTDSGGNYRQNRLGFQKHKLDKLLEIYYPRLTEWQNMQLNGYDRIWDCGCNVFEYINRRNYKWKQFL